MTESEQRYIDALVKENEQLKADNFQLRDCNEQLKSENTRMIQHEKDYMANSQVSYSEAVEMKNRLKRVLKFVIDEM